jgi:hypothetical protein
MVVNAVSVSKLRPRAPDITAKMTSVIAGENIPSALAIVSQLICGILTPVLVSDQMHYNIP